VSFVLFCFGSHVPSYVTFLSFSFFSFDKMKEEYERQLDTICTIQSSSEAITLEGMIAYQQKKNAILKQELLKIKKA
jgi:hypothetical protein